MLYKVLKAFPLSSDGITARDVQPGEVVSVPEGLTDGLKREGFIAPVGDRETKVIEAAPETGAVTLIEKGPVPAEAEIEAMIEPLTEAVEIPADWPGLHWTKRIKLATALGADQVTADEANAVIEAAVAKRAE